MADVHYHETTTRSSGTSWALALVVLMLVAVIAWFVFANTGAMERGGDIDVDVNVPAAPAPSTPAPSTPPPSGGN